MLSVSDLAKCEEHFALFCFCINDRNTFRICQDIYCLDADGSLFDAALLAAVAAFSHCKI